MRNYQNKFFEDYEIEFESEFYFCNFLATSLTESWGGDMESPPEVVFEMIEIREFKAFYYNSDNKFVKIHNMNISKKLKEIAYEELMEEDFY